MRSTSKSDMRPSFQWYPDDWLAEPGLRVCDLGARGLWIDLICFMFRMSPRGELRCPSTKNGEKGRPMSKAETASLVGRTEAEVEAGLKQLTTYGVLEIADDGAICSRRQVREEEQRQSKAEAGRKGGLVSRPKQDGSSRARPCAHPSPSPPPSPSPSVPSETNPTSLPTEVPKAFTKGLVGRFFTEQPQDVQQRLCRIAANTEAVYSLWALERALDDLGRQLSRGTKVENPAAYFATLCGKRIEQWQKDETTRAEWEANHKRDQDTEQEEQERLRQFPTDPEAQERWLKVQARFKAIKRAGHLSAEVTAVDMAEAKKALQEYLKKLEEQSNG